MGLLPDLTLLPPAGYLDMVQLERHAALIGTDSGGVQKEAYFHGVRCVTLRDQTEWVEMIDLGWDRLAVPDKGNIVQAIGSPHVEADRKALPYGNGNAAARIASAIARVPGRMEQ
jgi:UDP-GlcNAc3NAcA epimerase